MLYALIKIIEFWVRLIMAQEAIARGLENFDNLLESGKKNVPNAECSKSFGEEYP